MPFIPKPPVIPPLPLIPKPPFIPPMPLILLFPIP
jgi:hypothetical protein